MRNKINVEYYENEFIELTKMRNSLLHFHQIPAAIFDKLYNDRYEEMKENAEHRSESIMERIYYLQKVDGSNGYRNRQNFLQENGTKRIHKTMEQPIEMIFRALAGRMAAVRLLVDVYEPMDDTAVKNSAAVVEVAKSFRGWAETNIGWRNHITFEVGTPGQMTITEKPEAYYGGTRYYWNAEVTVDHSWIDVVRANKIDRVDIGGKAATTVWAEEILEHDLVDDDVKLFKAKVLYTKVPRDISTWAGESGDGEKIVFLEDKHIAIQPVTDGRDIITTGKDASWAIRTMRGRMKKKMLQMMDIL